VQNFIDEHKEIWGDKPLDLIDEYNYHKALTAELDKLNPDDFNNEILYKIVLWKVSRFPYISLDLLSRLKSVAKIKPGDHKECQSLLSELLSTKGIALPMASTILRFLNPKAFQIIDDRAYRVLLPGEPKYPTKPQKISKGYLKKSTNIYFNYLSKLHEISGKRLPFEQADRILYQLDIKLGNKVG
jgi:hypothetical protein